MQCSEVYRITAIPVPSDATFSGIPGSKWLVKGFSRASQWGRYGTDRLCTTLINADTCYTTVYFDEFSETWRVDATEATQVVYAYRVTLNGTATASTTVTAPPVEALRMVPDTTLTAQAGCSYELAWQFFPTNSETSVSWESDNAFMMVHNGVVTILEDAPIGDVGTSGRRTHGSLPCRGRSLCVVSG